MNRLTSVGITEGNSPTKTVRYGYTPEGQRVKQIAPDGKVTWFIFDGLSVLLELGSDKKPVVKYVPGISKTRLDLPTPLVEYYLYDGLGSVAQLTDEVGMITSEYFYEPFGGTRNGVKDPFNRNRFVGLASDDNTGLIYMNARWYDATVGRFLSRDLLKGELNDSQSLNLYPYVENNPINLTDVAGTGPEMVLTKAEAALLEAAALAAILAEWARDHTPSAKEIADAANAGWDYISKAVKSQSQNNEDTSETSKATPPTTATANDQPVTVSANPPPIKDPNKNKRKRDDEQREAEQAMRKNEDLQDYAHRKYKPYQNESEGGRTNDNLTPDQVREVYREWINQGRPVRK